MRVSLLTALVGSLTALAVTSAAAASVTVVFDGTVTRVIDMEGLLDGSVQVGSPFSGSFTYPTTGIDLEPSPTVGVYDFTSPPAALRMQVGAYTFDTPTGEPGLGLVVVNGTSGDRFHFGARSPIMISGPIMDPATRALLETISVVGFTLEFPLPGPFSSDELPTSALSLSGWSTSRVLIDATTPGGAAPVLAIEGQVTTVVPEPGTLHLLAAALLLLGVRTWRRRAH